MQTTAQLLMIQPVNFCYNSETAVNNSFQVATTADLVQTAALHEFTNMVECLRRRDIDVFVLEDTPEPHTPDAIFPNNWISFHAPATICLYPLFANNRRAERKPPVIERIRQEFQTRTVIDWSHYEKTNQFLEGTGSMVFDRVHKIAYACYSPRTNPDLLQVFCKKMAYTPVLFDAIDTISGLPIYHTNVMMCIADQYAVVCMDCIPEGDKKNHLKKMLQLTGKTLINISQEQMNCFAGNMLQVHNRKTEKFLIMSSQAFGSLNIEQQNALTAYNTIIQVPLRTIETHGGGSARCMIAEVFV